MAKSHRKAWKNLPWKNLPHRSFVLVLWCELLACGSRTLWPRYMQSISGVGPAERLAASRAHPRGGSSVSERSPPQRIGGPASEPKRSNAHATPGPRSSHLALDRKRDALNCALHYSEDAVRICRLPRALAWRRCALLVLSALLPLAQYTADCA